jgi:hypothetical protein
MVALAASAPTSYVGPSLKSGGGGPLSSIGGTPNIATPPPSDGPKPKVDLATPIVVGGEIPDAQPVVAKNRYRFLACHKKALATDPQAEGKVRLTLKVGPDGSVFTTTVSSTTASPSLTECARRATLTMQFSPPGGGGATLMLPLTFVRSS